MSVVITDNLQGNYSIGIKAGDTGNSIIFSSSSNIDIGNLDLTNVSNIISLSDITLNPSGAVLLSNKAIKNVSNLLLVPGTDPANANTLWANASGIFFGAGTSGGATKLSRSLNESYGNVSSDANIAVTSYPVLFSAAGATGNIMAVNSPSGTGILSVSNALVDVKRPISLAGNLTVTGNTSLTGDVSVAGNMNITGNITTINSQQVNLQDSTLYLNSGYNMVSGRNGGMAVNFLPTSSSVTISSAVFTPGVAAVSNPTITATFANPSFPDGSIIQVSGSTSNDGIYEVLSTAINNITIRGIGITSNNSNTQDIVANQFVSGTSTSIVVRIVTVGVIRVSTTGTWQIGSGANNTALAYKPIGNVSFFGSAPTANAIPIFTDTTGGNISTSSVTISGANIVTTGNISVGNVVSSGNVTSSGTIINLPTSNSTATVITTTGGANIYTVSSKVQTTDGVYANCMVFPVGLANAVVVVSSFVHGKRDNAVNSIGARVFGSFLANGTGFLSAMSNNIKEIIRNAGTSANYNANVIASGGNVIVQVSGNTGETVNWQAYSQISYSVGFT